MWNAGPSPPRPPKGKLSRGKKIAIGAAVVLGLGAVSNAFGSNDKGDGKNVVTTEPTATIAATTDTSIVGIAGTVVTTTAATTTVSLAATVPVTAEPTTKATTTTAAPMTTQASTTTKAPTPTIPAPATTASTTPAPVGAERFANCTEMRAVYPHGVGLPGAVDQVAPGNTPVTNFTADEALYNANTGSDRDKDGIACESK